MDEFRNIIKVASIYMATIIGAGFASGQEIVQFFSTYYEGGFYGIILAGVLFAIIGYVVLDKVYTERIKNYDEFLFPTVGWIMGWVVEIAVCLFMLSVFCIMIAGSGNIIMEKLGIPFNYGTILMSIICMVFLLTDIKGIVTLSSIITPVLIAGITAVGLFVIMFKDTEVFNIAGGLTSLTQNWAFSSLIYVGYNSIIAIVVMCSLLPHLKSRRTGIWGGIIGGLMLCFIAFIINFAMFIFHPDVMSKEMPVLSITAKYSSILNGFYAIILWLAMFISAITSGFGFTDRVSSKIRLNKKLVTVIVCAVIIPLSNFGFSNLISTVYPLFGYLGLFIVIVTLMQGIKLSAFSQGKIRARNKK